MFLIFFGATTAFSGALCCSVPKSGLCFASVVSSFLVVCRFYGHQIDNSLLTFLQEVDTDNSFDHWFWFWFWFQLECESNLHRNSYSKWAEPHHHWDQDWLRASLLVILQFLAKCLFLYAWFVLISSRLYPSVEAALVFVESLPQNCLVDLLIFTTKVDYSCRLYMSSNRKQSHFFNAAATLEKMIFRDQNGH